jgi:hypothetical protein
VQSPVQSILAKKGKRTEFEGDDCSRGVARQYFILNEYCSGLYSRLEVWRANLQLWPMTDRSLRPYIRVSRAGALFSSGGVL